MFSFIHHFSLVYHLILYTKTGTPPFQTYRVQMHQSITDKFPVAHCALRHLQLANVFFFFTKLLLREILREFL